ncbi:chromosome segregation protein Csm1/Pcs1 domain-containing protein [Trichoderma austrokoningii]
MRDRPAAAANRVTKQSRNRPRRTNAKIKSVASTSAKRPRNDKNEMDIAMSPDGSIASGIDDEARPLAQSDSSKQSRPRHKVSRDRNNPNNSSAQDDRTSAPNSGESNNKRGSKYQDSDGDGDTQRELAEAHQKYSILERRFHDLHEIAAKKAEENFELLKAKTSENTRVADEFIAELKEEIAQYTKQIQEMEQLQAHVSANKDTIEALQTELAETDQALAKAKSENKALLSKLAASRHIESNGKGSAAGSRTAPGENNQVAQIKEELYADLTGLIIRDVRRVDKEDVFDCIQTGRNGTLHFKLALEDLEAAESYEDVQFAYRPQLDESRDGDLIDVLPDYLTEEITFPRHQASKFYARVIKSLMERVD